jgi:protein PsiE
MTFARIDKRSGACAMAEYVNEDGTVQHRRADSFHERLTRVADGVGNLLVDAFHYLALFAIGGSIVWSAVVAFAGMAAKGHAAIDDILLLFIYLELGAMVGIYFKTNHMPVRFLIYVAMTALTRLLISDVQAHHQPDTGIVLASSAILLLALATLVIRYGSSRFPSGQAGRGTGR